MIIVSSRYRTLAMSHVRSTDSQEADTEKVNMPFELENSLRFELFWNYYAHIMPMAGRAFVKLRLHSG